MAWHILKGCESSPCSQGLEEVSSEAICWDGERFVPSNGPTTLGGYCLPDSGTEYCHDSRSGTMCRPSTEIHGEDESMSSAADSLAKTFPQPERALELMVQNLECGITWQGSFARFDRDSSSWKTPQCSLLEGLDKYLETWPRWGTMRSGVCWERLTPEHLTSVTESGSLPGDGRLWMTPKASDGIFATPSTTGRTRRMSTHLGTQMKFSVPENGGRPNPDWIEWLMGWPIGWTASQPLETDKYRQWQQQHSAF